MGRPRNEDPTGGVYHVYARGNNREHIFVDDVDRILYLRLLEKVVRHTRWACLAYCLMGNHLHLLIRTRKGNLGSGMSRLHGPYAQAFNKRHGRVGHVFQGPFGSTPIEDHGHMCMTVRYVALNPVEAGMCSRPEEWEWSSCRATLDGDAPEWLARDALLGYFEWLGGVPRERYAALIMPAR